MSQPIRYEINAPHIVHEVFEDAEAAIINLKNGNYYSLDPVGADFWQLLATGPTVAQMTQALQTRYEASAGVLQEAVSNFVATLQSEDLIVAVTTDSVVAPALPELAGGGKRRFAAPVLERYNDMQELLLLDPIHEVEEAGWPHRAEAVSG